MISRSGGAPRRPSCSASAPPRAPQLSPMRYLRTGLTAALAAVTGVSAYCWYADYAHRSAAHVWWFGWVTALSTGLGVLPVLLCKGQLESGKWVGLSNAVAAGMMTAASAALIEESLTLQVSGYLTPLQCVVIGAAMGIAFVGLSQLVLSQAGDARLGILEDGMDARRALLIVLVMTVHSFSEGIGIGASFGGSTGAELGMLVTTTLAVHNVPEGFAVSSVRDTPAPCLHHAPSLALPQPQRSPFA